LNKTLQTGSEPVESDYPELRASVKAWADLPEQVKAAIKTLIETHKAEKR